MKQQATWRIRPTNLAVALVVGLAASGAAQAVSMTQTQTLNSANNPTSTPFNGFNVAGGTLTGVALEWDMDAALTYSADLCLLFGDCATDAEWYFGGDSGAFELIPGGLANNIVDLATQPIGFDLTIDDPQTRDVQMALAGALGYTNLADFLGAGVIGEVASLFGANGFPGSPDTVALTGDITLTYTYDAGQPPQPPLPAPATLALLGLGLGGLSLQRKRKAR
jgi:hypothetical protein